MVEWVKSNEAVLWWLTAIGVVLFVGSLILVPALAVRIPSDYFTHERRPPGKSVDLHPVVRLMLRVGKNLLGLIFVLAGLAMLVLPGQGLLTIVLGFLLLDIPGKYRLERWLIARPSVYRPLNWIRKKAGREPLRIPAREA